MAGQFCNFCGNSLAPNATFCTNCGKSVTQVTPPVQETQSPSSAPNPTPAYTQPVSGQYYQPVSNNYQNGNNDYLKQPMTVGQYIVTFIVMAIPLVGVIMMFVWAFGSNVNINKKNYCRAILIMGLIGIVLWILLAAFLVPVIMTTVNELVGSGNYY